MNHYIKKCQQTDRKRWFFFFFFFFFYKQLKTSCSDNDAKTLEVLSAAEGVVHFMSRPQDPTHSGIYYRSKNLWTTHEPVPPPSSSSSSLRLGQLQLRRSSWLRVSGEVLNMSASFRGRRCNHWEFTVAFTRLCWQRTSRQKEQCSLYVKSWQEFL